MEKAAALTHPVRRPRHLPAALSQELADRPARHPRRPQGVGPPAGFLGELHAFRAFAIVNIVAIHAFAMAQYWLADSTGRAYPVYPALFHSVESVLAGSTLYFALISGALCTAVLAERGWHRFYRSKLLNVLLPYALMTTLFTAVEWRAGEGFTRATDLSTFPSAWISNLFLGQAVFAYWYIPVVAVLFALTPLLMWAMRRAAWSGPVLMALPLVFSRTDIDISFRTVVYFVGAYTLGLWLGRDVRGRLDALAPHRTRLATLAAVTTILAGVLMHLQIDFVGLWSGLQTVVYVQKLSIAALVLLALRPWARPVPPLLDALARHAFAIYFLHVIVLRILIDFALRAVPDPGPALLFVESLLLTVIALLFSWGISRGLQALLGHRSRWLVGA
jgi:surface polysaccharide O-acyltransferase-like enzyme